MLACERRARAVRAPCAPSPLGQSPRAAAGCFPLGRRDGRHDPRAHSGPGHGGMLRASPTSLRLTCWLFSTLFAWCLCTARKVLREATLAVLLDDLRVQRAPEQLVRRLQRSGWHGRPRRLLKGHGRVLGEYPPRSLTVSTSTAGLVATALVAQRSRPTRSAAPKSPVCVCL